MQQHAQLPRGSAGERDEASAWLLPDEFLRRYGRQMSPQDRVRAPRAPTHDAAFALDADTRASLARLTHAASDAAEKRSSSSRSSSDATESPEHRLARLEAEQCRLLDEARQRRVKAIATNATAKRRAAAQARRQDIESAADALLQDPSVVMMVKGVRSIRTGSDRHVGNKRAVLQQQQARRMATLKEKWHKRVAAVSADVRPSELALKAKALAAQLAADAEEAAEFERISAAKEAPRVMHQQLQHLHRHAVSGFPATSDAQDLARQGELLTLMMERITAAEHKLAASSAAEAQVAAASTGAHVPVHVDVPAPRQRTPPHTQQPGLLPTPGTAAAAEQASLLPTPDHSIAAAEPMSASLLPTPDHSVAAAEPMSASLLPTPDHPAAPADAQLLAEEPPRDLDIDLGSIERTPEVLAVLGQQLGLDLVEVQLLLDAFDEDPAAAEATTLALLQNRQASS